MGSIPEHHIDLNDLWLFAKVVEHGGFSQAGRALGLQKAKLSRRVAQLEERLGVRLIQRTTRSFSVTEAGQGFYRHCQAMLVEAEAAEAFIAVNRAEPRGTLRVACPVALLHSSIGDMIVDYMVAHPQVRVVLDATNRRVDLVAEGVDIAIRVRPPPLEDSDLVVRVLAERAWTIAGSPALIERVGRPAAPGDLSHLPTVDLGAPNQTHVWELLNQDGSAVEVFHSPQLCTDDMIMLKKAGVEGVGFIMLPSMMVVDEVRRGALIPVLDGWRHRVGLVHAVYPSRRGLLPSVRSLIDFLVARFEAISEE